MSLINKMLQELDRRHAISTPDGALPPRQVRALDPQRPGREWFWRIFAGLMLIAVAWVLWIAYQLQPRSLATDAALRAADAARRAPVAPQAQALAPAPAPAVARLATAQAAKPPQPVETFRLVSEISTPISERQRGAATSPAAASPTAPKLESQPAAPAAALAQPRTQKPPGRLGLDLPPARILNATASAPPRVEKRDRERTAGERAEAEFRRAAALLNQGRVSEAEEVLGVALASDAAHEPARQALVALLLEQRRVDDARRLLQEGLAINPAQVQFATVLARILIERRDYAAALEVLARPAGNAETHALRGNAQQRMARHREAVEAYDASVRAAPQVGAAWLGLAISLEAIERRTEAAEAYRRAVATGTLGAEVRDYAEQRARALQ